MSPAITRIRPAVMCPDYPDLELIPCPGGAAKGMCPVDGASHQMEPPKATA